MTPVGAARLEHPSRREALALLGGAAVLAACGGKTKLPDDPPATAPTTKSPPPTAAAAPPVFPLTGLPVDDPARASRAAITVKIDNAPVARPQSGLDAADLVFEEVVEGGVVRFASVFHSRDAASIGPVRSVRAEDATIVTPLGGHFVYSGGNDIFNAVIRKAPVSIISEDNRKDLFNRRRDRRSPANLYTSTGAIHAGAPKRSEVPPAFFSYRPAGQPLGGGATPARELSLTMGERTTLVWSYDDASARWLRTTNGTAHVVEGGARLSFPNVVIQFCRYQPTAVIDSSGSNSPEAVVLGDGEAWVLSGPALAKGRWTKPTAAAVTGYVDASGQPLLLQPGPTWVVLAPLGAPNAVR